MKHDDPRLIDLFQQMLEPDVQTPPGLDGDARDQEPAVEWLHEMVETVQALQATVQPIPDMSASLARVRTRVMASITDTAYESKPQRILLPAPSISWWRRLQQWLSGGVAARTASAAVMVLLVFLGMSTAITVSAQSLPGQPLYPVKRTVEEVRLFITMDPVKKEAIKEQLNQERLHEINELFRRGTSVRVTYEGELKGREGDGWRIGEWVVVVRSGDEKLANMPPGTRIRVEGITSSAGNSHRIVDATWSRIRIAIVTPTPTPSITPRPAQPGDHLISAPTDTPAPILPTATPEPTRRKLNLQVPPTATATPRPTATPTPSGTPTPTPTPTSTNTPLPTLIPEYQARGRLTGITPTSIVVEGQVYQLAAGLSTEALQIGSQVQVIYRLNDDQTRLATRIIVLVAAPTPSIVQRSGRFTAVDSGSITVEGTRFLFTAATQFPAQPLAVGQFGRVTGHTAADGISLFADKIEIYYLAETVLWGTVRSVQGSMITVESMGGSITVDISGATISGRIQPGVEVEISGKVRPDGVVVADRVTVTTQPATATPQPATATPTPLPTATATATPQPSPTTVPPSPTPSPTTIPPTATSVPPTATPTPNIPGSLALPTPQPSPTPQLTFASPTPATPY